MREFLQALPALLGVLFGAAATYLSTTATERSRWQRSQSVRWDERRIAAYTDYAHTLKHLISVVVRIAAFNGVHPDDDRLDPAEGLPLLAAVGEERTVKWEAVLLLGSPEVISSARTWHQNAGELQVLALGNAGDGEWITAIEATSQARRGFYEAVRRELGIPMSGSTDVFEWQMTKYLQSTATAAAPAAIPAPATPAPPAAADPDPR
jgi:hypothetical protein